jgi:hypothetical protein
MADFDAEIEAIRRAGGAGEQAGAVDLAGALSSVPGALPGARSAQVAAAVATVWAEQVRAWSNDVRGLGEGMTAAADRYAADDAAAAEDLGSIFQLPFGGR